MTDISIKVNKNNEVDVNVANDVGNTATILKRSLTDGLAQNKFTRQDLAAASTDQEKLKKIFENLDTVKDTSEIMNNIDKIQLTVDSELQNELLPQLNKNLGTKDETNVSPNEQPIVSQVKSSQENEPFKPIKLNRQKSQDDTDVVVDKITENESIENAEHILELGIILHLSDNEASSSTPNPLRGSVSLQRQNSGDIDNDVQPRKSISFAYNGHEANENFNLNTDKTHFQKQVSEIASEQKGWFEKSSGMTEKLDAKVKNIELNISKTIKTLNSDDNIQGLDYQNNDEQKLSNILNVTPQIFPDINELNKIFTLPKSGNQDITPLEQIHDNIKFVAKQQLKSGLLSPEDAYKLVDNNLLTEHDFSEIVLDSVSSNIDTNKLDRAAQTITFLNNKGNLSDTAEFLATKFKFKLLENDLLLTIGTDINEMGAFISGDQNNPDLETARKTKAESIKSKLENFEQFSRNMDIKLNKLASSNAFSAVPQDQINVLKTDQVYIKNLAIINQKALEGGDIKETLQTIKDNPNLEKSYQETGEIIQKNLKEVKELSTGLAKELKQDRSISDSALSKVTSAKNLLPKVNVKPSELNISANIEQINKNLAKLDELVKSKEAMLEMANLSYGAEGLEKVNNQINELTNDINKSVNNLSKAAKNAPLDKLEKLEKLVSLSNQTLKEIQLFDAYQTAKLIDKGADVNLITTQLAGFKQNMPFSATNHRKAYDSAYQDFHKKLDPLQDAQPGQRISLDKSLFLQLSSDIPFGVNALFKINIGVLKNSSVEAYKTPDNKIRVVLQDSGGGKGGVNLFSSSIKKEAGLVGVKQLEYEFDSLDDAIKELSGGSGLITNGAEPEHSFSGVGAFNTSTSKYESTKVRVIYENDNIVTHDNVVVWQQRSEGSKKLKEKQPKKQEEQLMPLENNVNNVEPEDFMLPEKKSLKTKISDTLKETKDSIKETLNETKIDMKLKFESFAHNFPQNVKNLPDNIKQLGVEVQETVEELTPKVKASLNNMAAKTKDAAVNLPQTVNDKVLHSDKAWKMTTHIASDKIVNALTNQYSAFIEGGFSTKNPESVELEVEARKSGNDEKYKLDSVSADLQVNLQELFVIHSQPEPLQSFLIDEKAEKMALVMAKQLQECSVGDGKDIDVKVDVAGLKETIKGALTQAVSNSNLMIEAYNKVSMSGLKASGSTGLKENLIQKTGSDMFQKLGNSFSNAQMLSSVGGGVGVKGHNYENFAIHLNLSDDNGKLKVDDNATFGRKTDNRLVLKGKVSSGLPLTSVDLGRDTRNRGFQPFVHQAPLQQQQDFTPYHEEEVSLQIEESNKPKQKKSDDVPVLQQSFWIEESSSPQNNISNKYANIENVDTFLENCQSHQELMDAYDNIPSLKNEISLDDFIFQYDHLFEKFSSDNMVKQNGPNPLID
jgi:hypothetical protein